jgi:hypothetical protein
VSQLRYAALATRNTEFYGDRVFDVGEVAALRPSLRSMAEPWLPIHVQARERGIRLLTADRIATEGIDPRQVMLVAYDWTPDAQNLVRQGVQPAILISFEPPVIAWSLYYHLEQISGMFPHTFMFEGARDRVHGSSRFHPLNFPLPCPYPRPTGRSWAQRRFLTMVNSNKGLPHARDLARWFDRPREVSAKRTWAGLRYRPVARVRYGARLRAIEAFSNLDDFDLYGEGWETRHPAVEPAAHANALRVYRGAIDNKLALLAGYRFALVFENTRYPGYISEKIFDCFYARCIPVYSGAPDVAMYIPPPSFIDLRQFSSYRELERFLRGLTEADARRYVDAAHAFLSSAAHEAFCANRLARDMVDVLAAVGERAGV